MATTFEKEWETPEYDSLASLAAKLVFRLPGCTDLMIRQTLQSVYRDFCKRACIFKTSHKINLKKGVKVYPIDPCVCDCVVDCVLSVSIGGRDLPDSDYRFLGIANVVVDSRYLPTNSEKVEMIVECLELPSYGSEKIPHHFIQHYGEALENGVLMRLYAMSNRAWSDPNQAALCARAYENELTEKRVRYHSGGNLSSGQLNYIKKGFVL